MKTLASILSVMLLAGIAAAQMPYWIFQQEFSAASQGGGAAPATPVYALAFGRQTYSAAKIAYRTNTTVLGTAQTNAGISFWYYADMYHSAITNYVNDSSADKTNRVKSYSELNGFVSPWTAFSGVCGPQTAGGVGGVNNHYGSASGETNGWIQYDFGEGKTLNRYVLVANAIIGADPTFGPYGMPQNWTFTGSNSSGAATLLDTRTGQDSWTALEQRSYSFANSTAYQYYRLSWTALGAGHSNKCNICQIGLGTDVDAYTNRIFDIPGCWLQDGSSARGWGIGLAAGTWDAFGEHCVMLFPAVAWLDTSVHLPSGWHNLTTAFSNGYPLVYLDGTNIYTSAANNFNATTGADSLDIGGGTGAQYNRGAVIIDDVSLYTVKLTPADAVGLAVSNSPTIPANCYLRWKFDEGTGTNLTDSSGNNRDGIIGGSTPQPVWTNGTVR